MSKSDRRASRAGGQNQIAARSRRTTFALFSIPGIFLYSLFFIYPVLMGVYYSLTDWNGIARNVNFIGLANYQKILFRSPRFRNAITFNLKFTVLLVIIILVLGIVLALLLNSKIRGITFFRASFFLPAVLCGVTIGLIFSQIFYRVVPLLARRWLEALEYQHPRQSEPCDVRHPVRGRLAGRRNADGAVPRGPSDDPRGSV